MTSVSAAASPSCLSEGDQRAGQVEQALVELAGPLPPDEKSPEAVVPGIGALDDPSTGFPLRAAYKWRLSSAADVGDDTPVAYFLLGVLEVIALVEAQMLFTSWASSRSDDDSVECFAHHPLVMHVGAGQRRCDRNASPVAEDVPFDAELATIGWIWTRQVPLLELSPSRCRAKPTPTRFPVAPCRSVP